MNWIWIGVIISLILIELVSLNFTAIWFVISALVSFILLKFHLNYIVQVLNFVIVGMLFIIIIRPIIIDKLIIKRDKVIKEMVKKYPILNRLIPNEILKEFTKEIQNTKKNKNNKKKKNK